jgi:hypothetical protein
MPMRYTNLIRQIAYPATFFVMIGSLWVLAWSDALVANVKSTSAPLFQPYNANTTNPADQPATNQQVTSIRTSIDE